MTQRACEANQQLAVSAIELINTGEKTLFMLSDQIVSRIITCGSCPMSSFQSKALIKGSISNLVDKVIRYDEYGWDPEITAIKKVEQGKQYRERNRESIREKGSSRSLEARIKQLKAQLGGNYG